MQISPLYNTYIPTCLHSPINNLSIQTPSPTPPTSWPLPHPPFQGSPRLRINITTMPKAQRSRACENCRRRRVKVIPSLLPLPLLVPCLFLPSFQGWTTLTNLQCDETPDVCQQCSRLGLKCSGPILGSMPVIIDMTTKVAAPRRKRKDVITPASARTASTPRAPRPQLIIPQVATPPPDRQDSEHQGHRQQLVLSPRNAAPIKRQSVSQEENAFVALRWRYKLPILYQPSQADAFETAFISHFVELNQGVRSNHPEIPFLTHLPEIHGNTAVPALKLSIRAASMAFYAKIHGEVQILVDSYRWYTKSLHTQRKALLTLGGQTIPTDEEVLVPIVLALYEIYAGTAPTSVFHHMNAATRILDMRGPRNCSSGVSYPLFKALRISDVSLPFQENMFQLIRPSPIEPLCSTNLPCSPGPNG